jgi:hypothetical protein
MRDLAARLARLRVPTGFAFGVLCLYLARPTWRSLAVGLPIALAGEGLRAWAAGHLEKNREVTRSGPYRFTGHPLYLGSAIMGAGVIVGAASVAVGVVTAAYLAVTFVAAIRTEEQWLRRQFGGEYEAYRAGTRPPAARRFSVARFVRNREYRAVIGLVVAMLLLALKVAAREWVSSGS